MIIDKISFTDSEGFVIFISKHSDGNIIISTHSDIGDGPMVEVNKEQIKEFIEFLQK